MAIGEDYRSLEAKLDYVFRDGTLLQTALTHSSFANERNSRGNHLPSNERLEFLGDAVLQLVISDFLYAHFSAENEGALTRIRQSLVCEKTLAAVAAQYELGRYLHLGNGEENAGCRNKPKILADAMEAVFAALYLDATASSRPYAPVILSALREQMAGCATQALGDAKTALQQVVEKDGSAILEYEVVLEEGPEHDKRFTVVAKVNNNIVGRGYAGTKKAAEMEAARAALALFGLERR